MAPVWDLIVVGSGPAGSLAALAALRQRPDARVLLLDRADFPRDKVCGDVLGPRCFDLLERYGLGARFEDFATAQEFALASSAVTAKHQIVGPVRVVPRLVLDERLLQGAVEAGAVWRRRRVSSIDVEGDRVVVDGELQASVVVGADGAESVVRRALQQRSVPACRAGIAVRGYAPTRSAIPVIMSRATKWPAYAWEFPIGDGRSNVDYFEVSDGSNRSTLIARA